MGKKSDTKGKSIGHGKSIKMPKKMTRLRSWTRCHWSMGKGKPSKKDQAEARSSHGKFATVVEMEIHRLGVTGISGSYSPRQPKPVRG